MSMVPYSTEWNRRFICTVLLCYAFGNFLFNPRKCTSAIITYSLMISYWPLPVGLLVYFLYKYPKQFLLFYAVFYIFTQKQGASHDGSRVIPWLGGAGTISHAVTYFLRSRLHTPYAEHIKSLSKSGTKFVFAVHPHSMFGVSTLIHFGLTRLLTRERFDNLVDFRILTINMNYWIPILRDYLMWRGFVCADKRTFASLAQKNISPVIVVGGAEETILTAPGSADLILDKRQGFVRQAIVNGAWLIPVYCFGDNEALPVLRSERVMKVQRIIQKWLTFATPIAMVYFKRTPLNMVIGDPIAPPQLGPNTSLDDQVTMYHSMYKKALTDLFNKYVGIYGTPAEKSGPGIRFVK